MAFHSRLGQFFLEHLSNRRIFIIVFNLVRAIPCGTLFDDREITEAFSHPIFHATEPKRQIADWHRAGVEVLMKPHFRRDKKAAFLPIESLNRLSLLPEEGKPLALHNQNVEPRAVAVGLLLSSDGKLRYVGGHHPVGQFKQDVFFRLHLAPSTLED